jgi:hypothetical protein
MAAIPAYTSACRIFAPPRRLGATFCLLSNVTAGDTSSKDGMALASAVGASQRSPAVRMTAFQIGEELVVEGLERLEGWRRANE